MNSIEKEYGAAKAELRRSDYKIIKCMEAFLCEEELPYDVKEIHEERNKYRESINYLESILNVR